MVAAEAEKHRTDRTLLPEVLQPDRELPVVEMVAATLPLPLPQVTGQLSQAWDRAVGFRSPIRLNTSSTGGCGAPPHRPSGAVQRVRHIGRSLPSVSFPLRSKNRAW